MRDQDLIEMKCAIICKIYLLNPIQKPTVNPPPKSKTDNSHSIPKLQPHLLAFYYSIFSSPNKYINK